jgi:hypothetical protein
MVSFEGTVADIIHESDLPAVLAMADVIVTVDRDHMDWLPKWLRSAGKVNATVQVPEGYSLGPGPDYQISAVATGSRKRGWKHGEDGSVNDTGAGQPAGK